MSKIDFTNYKFHCSSLKLLMVQSRSKTEVLSKTTQSFLKELWVKEVYGRDRSYKSNSKYTMKGTAVESDSLELVKAVTGKTYFKNNKTLENEFIIGTPDVKTTGGKGIDVKSSWDIWTFMNADIKYAMDEYYYQMLGYMWLSGLDNWEVDFCLVNTPETLIYDEAKLISGWDEKYMRFEEAEEIARKNNTFDDIPENQRLKRFQFTRNDADIEAVKHRILCARAYMSNLSLGNI